MKYIQKYTIKILHFLLFSVHFLHISSYIWGINMITYTFVLQYNCAVSNSMHLLCLYYKLQHLLLHCYVQFIVIAHATIKSLAFSVFQIVRQQHTLMLIQVSLELCLSYQT